MAWTRWVTLGATFAGLGVAFGAFGAHALKTQVAPEDLAIFETGVRYQMYHAFALLALGLVANRADSGLIRAAGHAFVTGIVIFCGTLYAMTFGAPRWFGAITPIGGLALMAGWGMLAVAATRIRASSP